MQTYIAIKKQTAGPAALDSASTGDKRTMIRDQATAASEADDLLREVGLKPVQPATQCEALSETQKLPPNGYYSLRRLDGFVLQATRQQADHLQERMEKEYYLVPDVALELPGSLGGSTLGQAARGSNWPEASGVMQAHSAGCRGEDVIIAILDTGCDADHVQFSESIIDFRYFPPRSPHSPREVRGFDTNGHGTHVTGIAAGRTTGVAPGASIMVAGVIESESHKTSLQRVFSALEWVTSEAIKPGNEEKAVILNMSLGFLEKDLQSHPSLRQLIEDILHQLLFIMEVLPVIAIGNDGTGISRFPGALPDVVAVGAVNSELQRWEYSGANHHSQPPKPDLYGFGVDVYSALYRTPQGHSRYKEKSGTSMAAPYVAGIAALLAQKHDLRGVALRNKLITDALPLEPTIPGNPALARFR